MSTLPDWIAAILGAVIPGFADPGPTVYAGYVEGEYVYVAAAAAGRIAAITAEEGQTVTAGEVLFRIDDTHQVAALRAAEANVAVAEANLSNLQTGSRSAEIDVIRATLDQARADQTLARTTLERSQRLLISGSISQAKVDTDRAMLQSADAHVAQLEAQLQVAELPARDAQRIAAEAQLEAARAQLDDARSALEDREVEAPTGGVVDKVFYDPGEVAGAGAPVVSVLPPGRLKALFFVPEADRASVAVGALFDVTCNGCAPGLTARLTRLASTPQYTPPIIYSSEERTRLVFRAEAVLVDPGTILPGQPLSLSPRP
jgi:HlyD family secretion protein